MGNTTHQKTNKASRVRGLTYAEYCYSRLRNEQTDWALTYKPDVERYDWNSSEHPRDGAGRFTKVRDVVERPHLQAHHLLHIGNQDTPTKLTLSDYAKAFNGLLRNAGRKSEMNGMSQSDEDVWTHVDKDALQRLLKEVNAEDASLRASGGPDLDKLFNYNGIIPKTIAERLSGGSRFFDPTKLRGKWSEALPSLQQSKPQEANPDPAAETQGGPSSPSSKVHTPVILHDGLSARKRNQVNKAIEDLVSDNPAVIEEFRPILINAWKQKIQEVNDHNQAIRQITGTRNPQAMAALIRGARNKTLDPAEKKNFDIMVDGAVNGSFGHLLQGRGEDGMLDLLSEGIRQQPDILDDDVAQLAVGMAGPTFFQGFDIGTAPSEWDAVPFSSDGIREYYRAHFLEPVELEVYSQSHWEDWVQASFKTIGNRLIALAKTTR